MKYIVSVSGGLGSAEALRRTIEKHGKENTVAVFCDVKGDAGKSHRSWANKPLVSGMVWSDLHHLLHIRYGGESEDTYRFLWKLSDALDMPIERLEDGRTIWAVFAQYKALRLYTGGGFFCKASEQLKREVFAKYLEENHQEGEYSIVLGMGWDEEHRVRDAKRFWSQRMGWDVPIIAPNTEAPYVENINIADNLKTLGLDDNDLSSAYKIGLSHDNCGGVCVQAGQANFALVWWHRQSRYLYGAMMEKQVTDYIGEPYTIMKDQRGGETTRLSMYDFIPRIEAGDYPKTEHGGCGCFTNVPMDFLQTCEVKPAKPKRPKKDNIKVEKEIASALVVSQPSLI